MQILGHCIFMQTAIPECLLISSIGGGGVWESKIAAKTIINNNNIKKTNNKEVKSNLEILFYPILCAMYFSP